MTLDAKAFGMKLRELGEGCDGARSSEISLLYDTAAGMESLQLMPTAAAEDLRGRNGSVVIVWSSPTVDVDKPGSEIPQVESVDVIYKGTVFTKCTLPTDALFWTDSSVDKFVYGYYEQLRIFPDEYALLKKQMSYSDTRKHILAVVHDNPSHSRTISLPGDNQSTGEQPARVGDKEFPNPNAGAGFTYLVSEELKAANNRVNVPITPEVFEAMYAQYVAMKARFKNDDQS